MALKSTNPTSTKSWNKLQSHFKNIEHRHLRDLFEADPNRAKDLMIQWEDLAG